MLRFGKFLKTVEPGLHFKLPFGVDTVTIVPTRRQLKLEFGFGTPGYLTNPIQIGEDPEAINAMWISGHNIFDECCPINARPPTEYGEEFASYHPTGVNATFADGSVHFLSETIDNVVLSALCTRSRGDSAGGSY